jgi:hypothetical protein
MSAKIITKFTVASDRAIDELLYLTSVRAKEKFGKTLKEVALKAYLTNHYSKKILVDSMNSMASQWLMVYVADEPAGYAFITAGADRPAFLAHKRVVQLADFEVLEAYTATDAKKSLLEKCLTIYKGRDAMWRLEKAADGRLPFFEQYGFVKQEDGPDAAVYMVNEQL